MAESTEPDPVEGTAATCRKRKRGGRVKKLLVDQEVEVRFSEEGLKGSWHRAVVVKCEKGLRWVKYDEILAEDNETKLIESISVSGGVDGSTNNSRKNYRGWIRPFPPVREMDRSDIQYGKCVDCLIDNIWWEGVIFDKDDGSAQRMVFFPDQGDRQLIDVSQMRSSYDWSETTGDWRLRGSWTLLRLLQKLEMKEPFPISTREIWYDISCMRAYHQKIGEWIFGSWFVWRQLVDAVIKEALSVSLAQSSNGTDIVLFNVTTENSVKTDDFRTEEFITNCLGNNATNTDGIQVVIDNVSGGQIEKHQPKYGHSKSNHSVWEKHFKSFKKEEKHTVGIQTQRDVRLDSSEINTRTSDVPMECSTSIDTLRQEMIDLVFQFHSGPKYYKGRKYVRDNAKKYLLSVGWNVEKLACGVEKFVSPNGEPYMSLKAACEGCYKLEGYSESGTVNCGRNTSIGNSDSATFDCGKRPLIGDNHSLISKSEIQDNSVVLTPEEISTVDCGRSPSIGNKHTRLTSKREIQHKRELRPNIAKITSEEVGPWGPVAFESKYFPEAVVTYAQYLMNGKSAFENSDGSSDFNVEEARLNLRKHLLSLGWRIQKKNERLLVKNKKNGYSRHIKCRYIYVAPNGKKYSSLQDITGCLMKDQEHLVERCEKQTMCEAGAREEQHFSQLICSSGAAGMETFDSEHLVPEYCHESLLEYIDCMEARISKLAAVSREKLKVKTVKVLKHLLYLGWTIYYIKRRNRFERRYNSPNCKIFNTLLKACKASLQEPIISNSTGAGAHAVSNEEGEMNKVSHPLRHTSKLQIKFRRTANKNMIQARRKFSNMETKMHFSFCKFHKKGVTKVNFGTDDAVVSSVSFEDSQNTSHKRPSKSSSCQKNDRKRKASVVIGEGILNPSSDVAAVQICKQSQVTSSSQHTPRTILSWLISNGAIAPRQKVRYLREHDGQVLMEGRITHAGIKCKCCKQVLTLSSFESHAGSSTHRPAANIFLQDGRSLLDCQRQLLESEKPKYFPHKRIKSDYSTYPSDAICSICQYGGTLILCDQCPSSFHLKCVGLEVVPEGKWFCASCKCSICGMSDFNSDCQNFTSQSKLFCDQCEREYHVGCLQGDFSSLSGCPEGYWFCNKTCSEIFLRLRTLVGKSNSIALEGYSWTILRARNENDIEFCTFDNEARTEEKVKIHVALDVLHECFVSMIEPRTKTDLVADVLYNKESELNRLNFWGFYTMLLEKGDEVVSVAAFRVYGDKVAEMPLVGTRVQYRRKGMCRLLINELEKLLKSLGVERFLLPAVPELLETWTRSFGFTIMSDNDKLMLSRYTFLCFQGTTMCQKFLTSSVRASEEVLGNVEQAMMSARIIDTETLCNDNTVSQVPEMNQPIGLPCEGAANSHALTSENVDSFGFDGSFPKISFSDDGLLQTVGGSCTPKDVRVQASMK